MQCNQSHYEYDIGLFVVVQGGGEDPSPPFWVGKLLCLIGTPVGPVRTQTMEWYGLYTM